MKKKILVTGGCGYIGSHTVVNLIENDFDVIVVDDLSNSNEFILDNIKKITGVRPEFIKCDLRDILHVENIFKYNTDIEAVIHFAAYKAVGESVEKPLEYYQNNIYSLINVLLTLKKFNINNFIFSSSATVYGNPKKLPITEQNEVQRPFSPYGNTKKIAEEILEDVSKSDPNFSTISLRYFNPIGAHDSGLIGELPSGIPNNLLPYITQTAAGKRSQLLVYGNDYPTPDGTPIRDYIHVVDLADAHVKALNRLLNNENESQLEIYNLGTGNGYSVMEIIKTFEEVSQQKLNYKITKRRDGDVPMLFASTTLAEQKLKWKAQRGLEDMIKSSWQWEKGLLKN
jgi:UDP-glucose 4-epimerase